MTEPDKAVTKDDFNEGTTRVEIMRGSYKGYKGTVMELHGDEMLVDTDKRSTGDSNELCKRGCALWIYWTDAKIIGETPLITEQSIRDSLAHHETVIMYGGTVYTLTPSGREEDFGKTYRENAIKTVQQNLKVFERREATLKKKIMSMRPMLKITPELVKAGFQYEWTGNNFYYILPLKYRPIKIYTVSGETKLIPKDLWPKFHRDVFLKARFSETGLIAAQSLYLPDTWTEFQHYHTQCSGDIKKLTVKTPEDFVKWRDAYEAALQIVNFTSLAQRNPQGMISDEALAKKCTVTDETDVCIWELVRGYMPVGTSVELAMAYDRMTDEFIAQRGVVVSTKKEDPCLAENQAGVQWDGIFSFMHDCNGKAKNKHGYNVPFTHLKIIGEVLKA